MSDAQGMARGVSGFGWVASGGSLRVGRFGRVALGEALRVWHIWCGKPHSPGLASTLTQRRVRPGQRCLP